MVHDKSQSSDRVISRRRALASVSAGAIGLLAGCRSRPFSEPEVQTDHLFVQNREDEQIEVALSVVELDGGDRVVYARYAVPADHALQFGDVLTTDTTYRVAARQPALEDLAGTSLDVAVETCEPDDPAGSVDVAVSVSSDGPDVAVFGCQTPYTRTEEFTYVSPEENRLGTPRRTVTSPTPS